MNVGWRKAAVAAALAAAAVMILGSATTVGASPGVNDVCSGTGGGCHTERVSYMNASDHGQIACGTCHANADLHVADPTKQIKPEVRFDLEACAGCHPDQYGTYTYGDSYKTKYGGSPTAWPKTKDFTFYNSIIDGHGFVREYNEERSHNVMLKDHYDIARGKFEVCLQCKSTKVAYYWDSGQVRTIKNTITVKGGHMTTAITVPAGTTVSMKTYRTAVGTPKNHEVQVVVTLPGGVKYSSYDLAGATKDFNWTWSALYALTVDGLPAGSKTIDSGNGCNHCHDPHRVGHDAQGDPIGFRIIRSSEKYMISKLGVNPYAFTKKYSFDSGTALDAEKATALCAQCHVEYVCGKSGIDGIDRDYFPWKKVSELEAIYKAEFPAWSTFPGPYTMDWAHGTGALSSPLAPQYYVAGATYPLNEPLIKSQHPESETFWNSRHYENGAGCYTCHMPTVEKADGTKFTSHWMASPNKYMEATPVQAFASAFGLKLDKDGIIVPCGACHGGLLARMKNKAINIQDGDYSMALSVQGQLMDALAAIKAAKDAQAQGSPVDAAKLQAACDQYRAAHLRWENLAVSENSMGFHDPAAFSTEMKAAGTFATNAKNYATRALGGKGGKPK